MAKKIISSFILLILFINLTTSFTYATDNNIDISSPVALLMDSSTGKILYEKNIHKKMYPASLTKVLTAILVLENCNLDDVCTVSYNAVMGVESGYITANLSIGEKLTVRELLNLIMISSSNDAAIVLAEHVSGNVEDFAKLMNKKASELGCKNTNFTNASGVHNKNNYSTAYDLALIGRYAMQNPQFKELSKKTYYKLPSTNKYPKDDRIYTTTNELLVINNNHRPDNYYSPYATGIKTGYTNAAGSCLMASSEKDGLNFICVILGSAQTKDGLSARYLDTKKLFDYGYSNYSLMQLAKAQDVIQTINIKNGTKETKKLELIIDKDIFAILPIEQSKNPITPSIQIPEKLKAPIKKGDKIGTIVYEADGISYSANLLAKNYVKPKHTLIKFLILFLILFLAIGFLKFRNKFFKKQNIKTNI